MRIGLYGMPTAGKSFLLEKIDFMDVIQGSVLLRQMTPDFSMLDEAGRQQARRRFASAMSERDDFILDGHYAFGSEIAFTPEDGNMYDAFVYIYVSPKILRARMEGSSRNRKYLAFDTESWQASEIEGLREYCHAHDKDFYVLDDPPDNVYADTDTALAFLHEISSEYSCVNWARHCVSEILERAHADRITLLDGDKTLTMTDTSRAVFGYRTDLYDGNFYTGFQAWKQEREFERYDVPLIDRIPVQINSKIPALCSGDTFILTSGHRNIWNFISSEFGYGCFCGSMMSAETKFFITKFLQKEGMHVTALGDGMNDYYMLRQADEGYLVTKPDGTVSRSLKGRNLEGLKIVRAG